MSSIEIATYLTYAILAGLVLFAGIVLLKIYKPKPKTKKEKKVATNAPTKITPKVKVKGKKETLTNDEGDVITLGGAVSETENKTSNL